MRLWGMSSALGLGKASTIQVKVQGSDGCAQLYVLPDSGAAITAVDTSILQGLKVRLDWTRSNAKRRLATFANLREWSLTSLAKVANLRKSSRVVANQRWSPRGQILKSLALASRPQSPRKLACPRLEDSTIFWKVKILWSG